MTKSRQEPVGAFLDKLTFTERFRYVVDTYATPEQWAKQMSGVAQPKADARNPTSRTVSIYPRADDVYNFVISHNNYSRSSSYTSVKISGTIYQNKKGRTTLDGKITLAEGSVLWLFVAVVFVLVALVYPGVQCLGLVGIANILLLLLRTRSDYKAMHTLLYEVAPPATISEA